MTFRVALLSDTHGMVDSRIAALVSECDMAVHAGDIGGERVLAQLRPRGGRLVAVRGNNDTAAQWSGDIRLLEELPSFARIPLPGGIIVVTHGHRSVPASTRHKSLRERYPEARAIVYGHSHRMVCDTTLNPWVLNPGAAGHTRTNGGPSCLILEADKEEWSVEEKRFPLRRGQW